MLLVGVTEGVRDDKKTKNKKVCFFFSFISIIILIE